jgi:transcriptional regulator
MNPSEWSYSYTASSGFATEDKISTINDSIDSTIKNRISTRIEGDCVTFTFNIELSDDNKIEISKIVQILIDTSKPKVKSFIAYPKIDNIESNKYCLIGRISYKKLTPNQTLDYIDVMAKADDKYFIKVMYNDITIVEFVGSNTEFETVDLGHLDNTPTIDGIIEIYAKVESGTLYIDQLQLYYNP